MVKNKVCRGNVEKTDFFRIEVWKYGCNKSRMFLHIVFYSWIIYDTI